MQITMLKRGQALHNQSCCRVIELSIDTCKLNSVGYERNHERFGRSQMYAVVATQTKAICKCVGPFDHWLGDLQHV